MAETLKTEAKTETKAPKPEKKYLVKLLKSYRVNDPSKAKIMENGSERALVGEDDKWEDGVQVHVAQGEYARLNPGTVLSLSSKEAKYLVYRRIGELTEDWD